MDLKELSRITNFSVSTISKAFNNADDVSEETKEIIFTAAKKHGCFGKYYKGKFHKKIIVIICPEIISNFYATPVEYLKKMIERDNGIVLVSTYDFDIEKQEELLDYYASYLRVDGIFVFGLGVQPKKGYVTPIVALGMNDNVLFADGVNSVIEGARRNAIEYLVALGHKRIAFAGEKYTAKAAEDIEEELRKFGLKLECSIISKYRFEKAGKDAADQLLQRESLPTAVMCGYDNIAIGLIKELKSAAVSVPEDVSVIGKDNISVVEYMEKKLSTIAMNHEDACGIVWDLMKKKIENPYYSLKQSIELMAEFIPQDTTAPPRENA